MTALLSIENLRVEIPTSRGVAVPVDGVSLEIGEGEMLGLVGESGSGKSMTAMSVLRMLPTPAARIASGRVLFGGEDLAAMNERRLRRVRGGSVGTIFQEPLTALNPVFTIGDQLTEPLRRHRGLGRTAARRRGVELLDMVGIRRPDRIMGDYPFQLSGGMRQRVMIAMAMSCEPKLLIADEPTTALDVTTQAQILDLMVGLQEEHGTAILLITHDLGVVAQSCQRVAVMHQGGIVETASVDDLFESPQADYTRRLLSFRPPAITESVRERREPEAVEGEPLLEVTDLVKHYTRGRGRDRETIAAVDGVGFSLRAGRTLAIVGESGSGKSTTGRAVLRLIEPTSGSVRFEGKDVLGLGDEALRAWRSEAQIIFQDTYASLDPRWKVGASLAEPLARHTRLSAAERRDRVVESLELVGLQADHANRFPHEFSGGQRQRIGIARALVLRPKLVVADEPVSALDVSVQAQVLDLMRELQESLGLAYLFITHDLSVVAEVADDVQVMSLGKVVESGPVGRVLRAPQHAYTEALLAAVPPSDPRSGWSRERRREIIAEGLAAAAAGRP
jgi:ABC-type microcin C transport system duplicated ATPase subunit YejF